MALARGSQLTRIKTAMLKAVIACPLFLIVGHSPAQIVDVNNIRDLLFEIFGH
jgi:hypothetical protein